MCEVVIRVVDRTNDDPYIDVGCTKRGDIVEVVNDGHEWGSGDLSNPHWRILKLPNVPLSVALNFLAPEVDTDPAHPSRMLQKRALKLDLAHASLPKAVKDWLADDTRAAPTLTLNVTPAAFVALRIVKQKIADPNVL